MQTYQFEKIYSQMEREYGKVRKGDEDAYAMLLFPIESNVLKIHRSNPSSNSRRLREAIALALFDIKGRCEGKMADTEKFRNADNEKLEQALLMAFDPYTNGEIMEFVKWEEEADTLDEDMLKSYYKVPVMCLLRIKDSVDIWEKKFGANGYFDFLEGNMGSMIQGTEMKYSVMLPEDM